MFKYGKGGGIYGDKQLTTLHLGSGGGSSLYSHTIGGRGGGAVFLSAKKL